MQMRIPRAFAHLGPPRLTRPWRGRPRGLARALTRTAVTGAVLAGSLVATPVARAGDVCGDDAPLIRATISGAGLALQGSLHQTAGPLRISLHSVGDEHELFLLRLRSGYSPADFRADLAAAFAHGFDGPVDTAALVHAIRHVVGRGGLDVSKGKTATMTVTLAPGTYYLADDSGGLPTHFRQLTVLPRSCAWESTRTSATVTMQENLRFGGDTTLPATGSILVKNTSTSFDHLHFLALQHVRKGTTRADVLKSFKSQSQPTFALTAQVGTDALSPGKDQVLTYSLPPGTYAEMCFFPDPDEGGAPHAFLGMVRIVHLR